ncbi:C4-dicarboxylate ABC transporter substrate-binding protein, partial [Paraburkholderia sp. SIMBA_050]
LVISSGPPGSTYWNAAQKYKAILAKNGVTLDVESSEGSAQNLERLSNPNAPVDVGFVQSGIGPKERDEHLVSLGSI